MPPIFKSVDIVLIFWLKRYFKSQFLLTNVTLQLVSTPAVELGSKLYGRYLKASVIAVMT